jgi:hypothetical protein
MLPFSTDPRFPDDRKAPFRIGAIEHNPVSISGQIIANNT